ncbi:hypothetical protein Cni_G28957 [Canna indica]|uniref:Uncharacterized protein n=1 Tax=Canna indica TaxID=4628 RepID=A0AAQ3L4E3_9LILI|nr:hypothetical protein Cni_G28957 [Canna indica]
MTLLLGLPNQGEIIRTPKEASEASSEGYMKDKFFPDGAAHSRTQIEDLMIQVHDSNNPEDIEDFCHLYILYVFSFGQIPSIGERIRLVVEQQQANPAVTYMRGYYTL